MSERLLSVLCVAGSAALHAALALGTRPAPARPPELPSALLDVALPEPEPPRPPEPPPPEPPRVEAKAPVVAKMPEPVPKPQNPEPSQPPPTAPAPTAPAPTEPPPVEPPATMASEQSAAWSMAHGNGAVAGAAVLAGASRSRPTPAVSPAVATPSMPEALPLAKLGKRPVPPALERALRQNYPARARRQGLSGEAKVRARIEASGQVRTATINFETSSGFGEACQRTLLASRWSAPLDAHGRAVATWVTYRCKFRIDD